LVVSKVKELFPNIEQNFRIFYYDDENEEITARSDMELKETYRIAESQKAKVIRLFVADLTQSSILAKSHQNSHLKNDDDNIDLNHYSTNDFEALTQIQRKLSEIMQSTTELSNLKQDQIRKIKTEQELRQIISELEMKFENLQTTNLQLGNSLKECEKEKSSALSQIKNLEGEIKEKEETIRTFSEENSRIKEEIEDKNIQLNTHHESCIQLGKQLQQKIKENKELKKEKENKMLLEAKFDLLKKDLDTKNEEYLEMSKVVHDVRVEKDFLAKKTADLEQQLEQEQQELENLQQSIVQIHQSKHSITTPTPTPTSPPLSSLVNSPSPPIKKDIPVTPPTTTTTTTKIINVEDLPVDARRWRIELEVLESMGYKDRTRNIELLKKYDDVAKVVSECKTNPSPTPKKNKVRGDIPADISPIDIQMLESMGFMDLQKNIDYLRKYKDVSVVVEKLL